ncbi:hypothetical protein [Candidatus Pyrohabitans sp.]
MGVHTLSRSAVEIFLVLAVSSAYLLLSYAVSQHEVNAMQNLANRYIAPLFLLIPTSGVIAFFYGLWSGRERSAFFIGFSPVFIFFISAAFFEGGRSYTSVLLGLFMGFCSGIIGYSGAIKKKGGMDWIILVPAGALLWIFAVIGGMR